MMATGGSYLYRGYFKNMVMGGSKSELKMAQFNRVHWDDDDDDEKFPLSS